MNEFIMLNWYHFDLNYKIIKIIKDRKIKKTKKNNKKDLVDRIKNDFQLKIKKD
tara:strand:- start:1501 stop:1662 length:162 start_codon:yes stop_codon:yes gene_type:complete